MLLMLEHATDSSLRLQRRMNSVYDNYVDYLVTDTTNSMETADRLFAQVSKGFVTRSDYNETDIRLLEDTLETVMRKLEDFDKDLNATSVYARRLFPKRLVNATSCITARKNLLKALDERLQWLSGFPEWSTFNAGTDLVKIANARSLLARTTKCMVAYKRDLDQFTKWLTSIQMPTSAN